MVTVEEIEHVSKLMKIDVDDHSEYLEKVQTMISYLISWILQVLNLKKYPCQKFRLKNYDTMNTYHLVKNLLKK